jgi:glyoxylate reductase
VADDDLIAALKPGRVAAAGLDVFEGDPNLHPEYAPTLVPPLSQVGVSCTRTPTIQSGSVA